MFNLIYALKKEVIVQMICEENCESFEDLNKFKSEMWRKERVKNGIPNRRYCKNQKSPSMW